MSADEQSAPPPAEPTPSPAPPVPGPAAVAPASPAPVPGPADPASGPADPAGTPSDWGRVADDGTVFVRTADGGERAVGQYPEGTPEEALRFFTERYEALAFEVHLLEQRIAGGRLSPDEARSSVKTLREQVVDAHAVGDLAALVARLDATAPLLAIQREQRRAEKAQRSAESREAKERIVAEAEKIAEGTDWRGGANRLRALLDEWKALPRLDRSTDDTLWRRFSSARTTYTRHRKQHFAVEHERRDAARVIKERLCTEAEKIATSTDWGATAGRYRDLMREWKAAGPAPRGVDDRLWARFRGAQDQFFGARDAANAELDQEYAANAEIKEQILVEAETIDPQADLDAAKQRFRALASRWDEAGKVPRDRVKELEGRMRKIEQSIRSVEDEQWRRSDPEKSARANDMVTQLESGLADAQARLEKARAGGDARAVSRLEDDVASKQAFLDMARKASADFT